MEPNEAEDASKAASHGSGESLRSSARAQSDEPLATSGAAQPPTSGIGSAWGTPPSNTVPYNSTEASPIFFQPLRWNVDSLYLSYKGKLKLEKEIKLLKLKKLAQSTNPLEVARAQYPFRKHVFEVSDRGAKQFPFVLTDNAYRVQCPKHGSLAMPVAYVKVSSHALNSANVEHIELDVASLVAELAEQYEPAKVSRIDLCVDFVSNVDMDSWPREAWVTRASSKIEYAIDDELSGWSIGQGGAISARLYDKTLEIKKSKKTWLYPLWNEAGWNGTDRVWRLEFEFNTEILGQLQLRPFRTCIEHLDGLWGYATTEWLKLTVPNSNDSTRSRWPIHPLWVLLASVPFDGEGATLSRTFSLNRVPGKDWLMRYALSALTSNMAAANRLEFNEGIEALRDDLWEYHSQKADLNGESFPAYIKGKVTQKIRAYNAADNAEHFSSEISAEEREEFQTNVEAYRKASRG